jgi:mannose-6-phosphate isomerase-like protein (cupin superfamily)
MELYTGPAGRRHHGHRIRLFASNLGAQEETIMTASAVDITRHRGEFFRILQQTARSQTAVMTIGPGQDAGPEETHDGDQIVYIVEGTAIVRVEGGAHEASPGTCVLIPARARHHVQNPGLSPLFFLTIYAPPAY